MKDHVLEITISYPSLYKNVPSRPLIEIEKGIILPYMLLCKKIVDKIILKYTV